MAEYLLPTLVAAAQSASTSSNLQLWSVVAVHDAEKRRELAALAGGQKHIEQAPLILLWVAGLARAKALAAAEDKLGEGYDYLESYTLAVVDAALAAQNAVAAAESLAPAPGCRRAVPWHRGECRPGFSRVIDAVIPPSGDAWRFPWGKRLANQGARLANQIVVGGGGPIP